MNRSYFATYIGDEIVPGKVFLVNEKNGEPKIFKGNRIAYFAYSDDPTLKKSSIQALKPTDEYEESLRII